MDYLVQEFLNLNRNIKQSNSSSNNNHNKIFINQLIILNLN